MTFRLPLSALLSQLLVAFTVEFEQELASAGHPELSLALGSNVLRFLDVDEGLRVIQIAELAGITRQAISQQVTHLEAIGQVETVVDPTDRRAKLVRLTPAGATTRDVCRPLFGEIERRWGQRHGDDVVQALRTRLEQVAANLDDALPHFPT